jgi:lysophospholipase L1-like esterase
MAASSFYYATIRHPFEPFLQVPPSRFGSARQPKPAFRILTLGGSTTYHSSASKEYQYPYHLQKALAARYGSLDLDVLNGGMDWYTAKHSLIDYVTYGNRWKPDVVIIMHGINDLYRSFSPPDFAAGDYNEDYSHFYGSAIQAANPPTFGRAAVDSLTSGLTWYGQWRDHEADYPVSRYVSLAAYRRYLAELIHYVAADGPAVILMTQPALYKPDMEKPEKARLSIGRRFCLFAATEK